MSVSKIVSQEKPKSITSSMTQTEGGNENFAYNDQDNDIEDRYVKEKCSHISCDTKSVRISVPEIIPEIAEEVAEEEYVDLEETCEAGLYETLGANDFTDAECGEPMKSQFLRIDFTPVDGIDDNPHLQQKCSDFWKFIRSQPVLQNLMVFPDKDYEEVMSSSCLSETSLKKYKNIPTPAVDWLETGVDKKMAFATKHPSKYCYHYNGNYMDEVSPPKSREAYRVRKSADRGTLQTTATETRRLTTSNAVDLCTQLEKWDKQHPKSMDPPGRVPNLTHAILQRIRQER